MSKASKEIDDFKAAADVIFLKTTGCNWDDLCGDIEPLEAAVRVKETPEEFVDYIIEKYNLDRLC